MDAREAEMNKLNESIGLRYRMLEFLFPRHELLSYYLVTKDHARIAPGKHEPFCRRFAYPQTPSFVEAKKRYSAYLDLAIKRVALGLELDQNNN